MKNLSIVDSYLNEVVINKKYSLVGEIEAVEVLLSLDWKRSMQLFEKYRRDLPTMTNTPRNGMKHEIDVLEGVYHFSLEITQMLGN
jgi:hypothetical protein